MGYDDIPILESRAVYSSQGDCSVSVRALSHFSCSVVEKISPFVKWGSGKLATSVSSFFSNPARLARELAIATFGAFVSKAEDFPTRPHVFIGIGVSVILLGRILMLWQKIKTIENEIARFKKETHRLEAEFQMTFLVRRVFSLKRKKIDTENEKLLSHLSSICQREREVLENYGEFLEKYQFLQECGSNPVLVANVSFRKDLDLLYERGEEVLLQLKDLGEYREEKEQIVRGLEENRKEELRSVKNGGQFLKKRFPTNSCIDRLIQDQEVISERRERWPYKLSSNEEKRIQIILGTQQMLEALRVARLTQPQIRRGGGCFRGIRDE